MWIAMKAYSTKLIWKQIKSISFTGIFLLCVCYRYIQSVQFGSNLTTITETSHTTKIECRSLQGYTYFKIITLFNFIISFFYLINKMGFCWLTLIYYFQCCQTLKKNDKLAAPYYTHFWWIHSQLSCVAQIHVIVLIHAFFKEIREMLSRFSLRINRVYASHGNLTFPCFVL